MNNSILPNNIKKDNKQESKLIKQNIRIEQRRFKNQRLAKAKQNKKSSLVRQIKSRQEKAQFNNLPTHKVSIKSKVRKWHKQIYTNNLSNLMNGHIPKKYILQTCSKRKNSNSPITIT